jgi:hypothetical protein
MAPAPLFFQKGLDKGSGSRPRVRPLTADQACRQREKANPSKFSQSYTESGVLRTENIVNNSIYSLCCGVALGRVGVHGAETTADRASQPDPVEMAERYGAETAVVDWRKRLVCSGCGSRPVDMVVSGTERR